MADEVESAFANALRVPEAFPPPLALLGAAPAPSAAQRFTVHERNRRHALLDALAANYPVVASLVGEHFFHAVATEYLRAHPPMRPALFDFGATFPAFLEGFDSSEAVACLGDVARLERAWCESCHAAEAAAVGLEVLAGLAATDVLQARFTLHPSARLLASAHPMVAVWRAHQEGREGAPLITSAAECALVVRPTAEVDVHTLEQDEHAFLSALASGTPLAEAAHHPHSLRWLEVLFDRGAIVAIHIPQEPAA